MSFPVSVAATWGDTPWVSLYTYKKYERGGNMPEVFFAVKVKMQEALWLQKEGFQ
jgi:hypothetical protein